VNFDTVSFDTVDFDTVQFIPVSRRRPVLWTALGSLCAVTGCGGPSASDGPKPFEVVVTADTAGWIVPCGCTSNQSGGMPRRGTLVAEARARGETLVVDAGGAAAGTSRYDRLKFAAILRGEAALGSAAHNLGASEAALGADELRRLARETGAPFVSANLRDGGGEAIASAVRTAVVGGRRVAITGVISPSLVPAGLKASPPHDAVLAATADLEPRPDVVVVLAYLPENELTALATLLPEVDVVVGGPTGQSTAPRKLGPATVLSVTNKGKFVAELKFAADRRTPEVEIVELSERFADDERQTANVRTFYDELRRLDLKAAETSFAPRAPAAADGAFRLAGSEACRDCHAEETRIAEASAHGHAWKTLVDRGGSEVDAYCQQCHTTAFGRAGGFSSATTTPLLVNVGCESCHGPSARHAADPKIASGFGRSASQQCTTCHDRENSPGFEYEAYWKKIAHGTAEGSGSPVPKATPSGGGR
jgi:hypothetical protein